MFLPIFGSNRELPESDIVMVDMRETTPYAKRERARPILLLSVLLWGGSVFAQQQDSPANTPVIRFVAHPDAAPAFALPDLDGNSVSLEGLRGKVILLNFWATWCPPCRAEIPDLIELQTKYAGKLQIVGLSVDDDSPEYVKKFVEKTRLNFPVVMAPGELRAKFGGIPALPTSFVLDTQGRVVQKHTGLRNPALYETEIRSLLGMPIQASVETFEDGGEVFLQHADRATELPGVDLSALTPEQKQTALRRFNAEKCTCPCQLTLAQCRVNDSACPISKAITEKIVSEISSPPAAKPAKCAAPGTPKQ